jgi:hypothetical protein
MSGGTAEVKFADINNDGELDIVTANVNDNDPGASIVMQGVCELLNDCNNNGVADICETPDCNINGIPDVCDILSGYSQDENVDWVPDECQIDCNDNSIPDDYEILLGLITDCNSNGIPDDCDWEIVGDCDGDGIPDGCEFDINLDFVPDDCQCNADFSDDGEVGVQDLIALIAAWGENPNPHTEPVEEDLNVDFAVDVHDLLLLMLDWGECSKFTLPEVEGACCLGSLQMCIESMQVACEVRNGVYHGDESTCDTVDCSTP